VKVVWNVPNVLTLLRVIAAPCSVFPHARYYITRSIHLSLPAITDALDGFIARRFDLYTEFGAALDRWRISSSPSPAW